jgi:hypothetical protein
MVAMLDNTLAGTLGVTTENPFVRAEQAKEEEIIAKGIQSLGMDASPEAVYAEGQRVMRLEAEMDMASSRIQLATQQMSLDSANYDVYKRQVRDEAGRVAQMLLTESVNPFFRQLMQSDLKDPALLEQNSQSLLQKQLEIRQVLAANFSQLGVDFGTQQEIMSSIDQQFSLMADGVDHMAKLPAQVLKNIQQANQLSEIEMGTALGFMLSLYGEEQVATIASSAMMQDPSLRAGLGQGFLNSYDRFITGATRQHDRLRLQDLNNPDIDVPTAMGLINTPLTSSTSPEARTAFSNSARYMVRAALESDFESQTNAVTAMSSPQFLRSLENANDRAKTDVAQFHNEMAVRYSTMLSQIADRFEGIDLSPNPDGTINVEDEGLLTSIARAISSAVTAPQQFPGMTLPFIGPFNVLGGGMESFEQGEGRMQLKQARKLVESYNASVRALNTIGDRRMVTGIVERVESSGRPDAVSSAGALGLMQLLPSTAREVATRLGMPENVDVMDPAINRQLGDQYFGEMFNKYSNMALALAAYNAGPGRVDSWLQSIGDPRSGDLSVSDWINRIPFKETREYVKRVLG